MARLRKADVETLMAAIDSPLLGDALSLALRRVLEVDAFDGDWPALVAMAAELDRWPAARRLRVVVGEPGALADLAVELNERRTLGPG